MTDPRQVLHTTALSTTFSRHQYLPDIRLPRPRMGFAGPLRDPFAMRNLRLPFIPLLRIGATSLTHLEGEKGRVTVRPSFARFVTLVGESTLPQRGNIGVPGRWRQSDSPAKDGLALFAVPASLFGNLDAAFQISDLHRFPPLRLPWPRRLMTPFACRIALPSSAPRDMADSATCCHCRWALAEVALCV